MLKLIECPRDAMQGIQMLIPTEKKIEYINQLLKVGFDTIDFGSFVSPKAIPQMADTAEVLEKLDLSQTETKLLAIVANVRGAIDACNYKQIRYLGFPFSISETFQQRNTHADIASTFEIIKEIQNLCQASQKELVVYISMGFGNPYGDPYNPELVVNYIEKLKKYGMSIFSLSDTVGVAEHTTIAYLFKKLIQEFPDSEFGAHLHSSPHNWYHKVKAAIDHGCKRFDSAIGGFGGCPMANDTLVGNMSTENLVNLFHDNLPDTFNIKEFENSLRMSKYIFP